MNKANCLAVMLALVVVTGGASLQAQNKYDVLARTLQPFGALFYSKSATKAIQADVVLREGPVVASTLLNKTVRISFQIPDKLRVEVLDPVDPTIVCRNGQRVWVYPRELADKSIPKEGARKGPPVQIPKYRLPIRDNQLALLPVFFQILRFEEAAGPDGKPAWSLEFRPSPELMGRASEEWAAVALIDQSDYGLRRLQIQWKKWTGSLDILTIQFTGELPPAAWEPDPALADKSVIIPPEYFGAALEQISSINFFR
jgi:hypothetical protein